MVFLKVGCVCLRTIQNTQHTRMAKARGVYVAPGAAILWGQAPVTPESDDLPILRLVHSNGDGPCLAKNLPDFLPTTLCHDDQLLPGSFSQPVATGRARPRDRDPRVSLQLSASLKNAHASCHSAAVGTLPRRSFRSPGSNVSGTKGSVATAFASCARGRTVLKTSSVIRFFFVRPWT